MTVGGNWAETVDCGIEIEGCLLKRLLTVRDVMLRLLCKFILLVEGVIMISCMNQVETLRNFVQDNVIVQSTLPPSYIRAFLSDSDGSSDIILISKRRSKSSAASLPSTTEDSYPTDLDVTGNPLEDPFLNENFDDSVASVKTQWESHLPLPTQTSRSIINAWNDAVGLSSVDEDGTSLLDIWVISNDGSAQEISGEKNISLSINGNGTLLDISKGEPCELLDERTQTVLLGRHTEDGWYKRSSVKGKGVCSILSPEMDVQVLKQRHLQVANEPASKVETHVLCRCTVSGHPVALDPTVDLSTLESYSCVSLELEWKKLSISVPLESATTNLVTQVGVGHHASPAFGLWKQLRLLQKLLDLLLVSWRDKKAPTVLPQENFAGGTDMEESFESLSQKLELLIRGGGSALQTRTGGTRESTMASGLLRRRSLASKAIELNEPTPHLPISLPEALDIASSGNRGDSDITDELWLLLTKCRSFEELSRAWSLVFREISQGHSKPYVRPKNRTKAGKLIQSLISGHIEGEPDLYEVEGCGIFLSLELLVELGVEKLTSDFRYIFLGSETVGKDSFMPPELLRNDLSVSRDAWLPSCGRYLGWLAQVHSSLEVLLVLHNALPSADKALADLAPLALKHFQSEASPVRSVTSLISSCWLEFHCVVNTREVKNLLTEKFDLLKLTLTSENNTRKVKSVFLWNRLSPIFPSQIYNSGSILDVEGENVMYYCAEALTISDLLCPKEP